MNELQVNTESLYQEAEKTVESIRKLKQILERQRNIINKMGGYWNGEGYEAATKNYMELSDKFSHMERANQDTLSKLPDSILD